MTKVLCHGTFDLMHLGHIKYLQEAKKLGDYLVVGLTADAYVNKGPGKPVFNEQQRRDSLAALSCVDEVIIVNERTGISLINSVKPDIYVKGVEYKGMTGNKDLDDEIAAVESHGGRVEFVSEDVICSSSTLLRENFGLFSPEVTAWLADFKTRFSEETVLEALGVMKTKKVFVVGDGIEDVYCYTTPLGQTGKGSFLSVEYQSAEHFLGGAWAVSKHCENFAYSSSVFGLHMVTKKRFIDRDFNKLFEVYEYNKSPTGGLGQPNPKTYAEFITKQLYQFDCVIAADFGNGFIRDDMVASLHGAKFLAVNTQINSGNRGFHDLNRYDWKDFIVCNEHELQLACRDRVTPIEELARRYNKIIVTRGSKGLTAHEGGKIVNVPALATKVVDRVGAGDACLAVASIAASCGFDIELVAFLGSVAAALDVLIVGNKEPVDAGMFKKYVKTLLR